MKKDVTVTRRRNYKAAGPVKTLTRRPILFFNRQGRDTKKTIEVAFSILAIVKYLYYELCFRVSQSNAGGDDRPRGGSPVIKSVLSIED